MKSYKDKRVFTLGNSIKYQEGSIVSKSIIKQNEGNVTLFAFDKNQFLSEHKVPYEALVLVIDGKTKIKISGQENIVSKGKSIILPADKVHSVKAVEKFKMVLIMIKSN